MPIISLIAALSLPSRAIGYQRALPWKKGIPADWENLFKVTKGCPMIMGRKSYDDENRISSEVANFVLTRQEDYQVEAGFTVMPSLEAALAACSHYEEVYIIGGQALYEEALPIADKMVLTYVLHPFEGDTFFPAFNEHDFIVADKKFFAAGENTPFPLEIVTYLRKPSS